MEKEKIIETIKLRIKSEYSKHKTIDWEEIAAHKIYNSFEAYFTQELSEVNTCVIDDVMPSKLEEYATFFIECDRKGMKPLRYIDYVKIG